MANEEFARDQYRGRREIGRSSSGWNALSAKSAMWVPYGRAAALPSAVSVASNSAPLIRPPNLPKDLGTPKLLTICNKTDSEQKDPSQNRCDDRLPETLRRATLLCLHSSRRTNSDGCRVWEVIESEATLVAAAPIRTEYTIIEHPVPQRIDPLSCLNLMFSGANPTN